MPAARKKQASNLELIGDSLDVVSLRKLLTNKRDVRTRDAARLGDVLLPWYEKTVAKPAAKLEGIAEAWQEHVPANIVKRSRLVGFERGTLKVSLESTTVRAELDAHLRAGLLRTLQAATRNALFRVKTIVQGGPPEA
ncbi:MAG TPA: DciA family protein [Phycisphaerae bacterium]|nr:DciA family protein [Phycisphaerae bacterium]